MRQISGINITNQGSGYTSEPTVTITGGGDEAFDGQASAKIQDGKVVAIRLDRAGSRYDTPPTVTITGGGGSGATAVATVNSHTYGMLIGAETHYGDMLGCVIAKTGFKTPQKVTMPDS